MGRTHALELARRGAKVVVNDIHGAEQIAEEIRTGGGEAVVDTHSVASEDGGKAIIGMAVDTWGRLDAVVTNATIYLTKPFQEMTLADFDAVIDVKLRAAFFVFHPAYLYMLDHGGGRLVGVTSGAGLQGLATQANYAAANSGLIGLFRTIALEGEVFGIKANLLNPGALIAGEMSPFMYEIPGVNGDDIRDNFLPERVRASARASPKGPGVSSGARRRLPSSAGCSTSSASRSATGTSIPASCPEASVSASPSPGPSPCSPPCSWRTSR